MWKFNDLRLFQEQDLYLVPLCIIFFLIVGIRVRKKYEGTPNYGYFLPALILRFLFAGIYAAVVAFYYGAGDTTMYFQALTDMRNALSNDSSVWTDVLKFELDPSSSLYAYFMYDDSFGTNAYMMNQSNYMVPRFALPFSIFFFNSYLCICFCLSFYSFAGCWRIFKMFVELYPHLHKKFAISILFLPSVLFWGGTLLKDSICLGSLGFALYGLYKVFIKREKVIISIILILISSFFLYVIKPYILLCLLPTFLLWVFLEYKNKIRNYSLRIVVGTLFGSLAIIAGLAILQGLTKSELASQYSSDRIIQTMQGVQGSFAGEAAGSNFAVQKVDNSTFGLISLFPLGIVSTLFRPFPWEANNLLMILSALEAFGFLLLTIIALRRIRLWTFGRILIGDPVIVFCSLYAILFAAIIGATTANFGALVRYKIPCVSFYLIMLFIIMDKSGKFSPQNIFRHKLS